MNKGVEILLERIASNPDEFLPIAPEGGMPFKWADIISAVYARKNGKDGHPPYYNLSFLSDEDVDAIFNKLQEIRGDHFTKCVMSTLLTDDSSQEAKREFDGGGLNHKYTIELMKKELERQIQERYKHGIVA